MDAWILAQLRVCGLRSCFVEGLSRHLKLVLVDNIARSLAAQDFNHHIVRLKNPSHTVHHADVLGYGVLNQLSATFFACGLDERVKLPGLRMFLRNQSRSSQ